MKYKTNLLYLIILFIVVPAFSQNKKTETVFITSSEPREKKEKEEKEFSPFIQMALNMSVKGNSNDKHNEYDEYDDDVETNIFNYIVPDGLEAHFGYGYLYKSWLGLSVNTGIDSSLSQELVAVPVYGMLTLTTSSFDDKSILLQAGLGHSFAIGRGNLSGTYQKYRLGLVLGELLIVHADASLYGYKVKDININQAGSFSIGVSIIDFLKE